MLEKSIGICCHIILQKSFWVLLINQHCSYSKSLPKVVVVQIYFVFDGTMAGLIQVTQRVAFLRKFFEKNSLNDQRARYLSKSKVRFLLLYLEMKNGFLRKSFFEITSEEHNPNILMDLNTKHRRKKIETISEFKSIVELWNYTQVKVKLLKYLPMIEY